MPYRFVKVLFGLNDCCDGDSPEHHLLPDAKTKKQKQLTLGQLGHPVLPFSR